jgi:plasmid stabilization system protein ParE
LRIRFTPEALQVARAKRAWWEQHRDKARRLFVLKLATVVAKLRDGADEERQRYALRDGRIIRRLPMPKTRNHVYYRLDPAGGVVEILVIWNATAGVPPRVLTWDVSRRLG